MVETRLRYHFQGAKGTRQLHREFRQNYGQVRRSSVKAALAYLNALDVQQSEGMGPSLPLFLEVADQAERSGVRPWLEHMSLLLAYGAAVFGGDLPACERVLRLVDRVFERQPSPWFHKLRSHLLGMHLALRGRLLEGR
jgi:hypothetical protein